MPSQYDGIYAAARTHMGQYFDQKKLSRQISQFRKDYDLEDSDFYDFFYWWYGVRKEDPAQSCGGIGVLPYVISEFSKWQDERDKFVRNARKSPAYVPPKVDATYTVQKPKRRMPKSFKFFRLDD